VYDEIISAIQWIQATPEARKIQEPINPSTMQTEN
jgi:hypothetical protein